MSKLRVNCFSTTLDGFSAGPNQSLDNPLGVGMPQAFAWFFPTDVFQKMQGKPGGTTGVDNDFALRSFENVGAWIMGRNMFGPIRGPWPNEDWKGWWGDEPPYHVPVFVLTHHARPPLEMKGGTTFHFITEGPERALQLAKTAANEKDVRIGGGTSTIRQYISAAQVDELHLALSPVLLGEGEPLFAGLNWAKLGYRVVETVKGEGATHLIIRKA